MLRNSPTKQYGSLVELFVNIANFITGHQVVEYISIQQYVRIKRNVCTGYIYMQIFYRCFVMEYKDHRWQRYILSHNEL